LCAENNVIALFRPPYSSNQLQPLDLATFGITKRMLVRVNRMDKLNIQTQQVVQVVCAFMWAANPVNVTKGFRNGGIDLFIDEDRLCCRVIPTLARCLLDPAGLFPVPVSEETEDEADEVDWNLYVEDCCELLDDRDAPDDEEE
jgi:hypothetical protein